MSRAFTLIEVLVAMFVVLVGAGGLFSLIYQTTSFSANPSSQLAASYLAQEGIEIVRNIRDTNFLKMHKGLPAAWDDGLAGCASGCEADFNDSALASYAGLLLKIGGGLYTYDSGTDTIFTRKITVASGGTDALNVDAEVSWAEKGRTHSVKAATKLYNWIAPTP
ncbi:MAG: prepilin-type N-terminal cleavage/methylation domain-containing protein [Candidatus Wildermuthbacteria bacterium]|nr:prepilin-type N-terminal cleavage/methylation domain-containing protein [Candidatus Wildermuthbacteria bacterium]